MNTDLRARLQESLGSAYILERELGGGMSRVFLASESRLRRKVVVKVLAPELAADVSAERFEREIMVAAQLSHPSIVPVLTAGDADGLPYYTMPFVEGESLRARLATHGMQSPADAMGMLRDVARALAYAHEHGVVHRDIKPDNVLLVGDVAVVTDFGIAKAITAARSDVGTGTLTGIGITMGTPAYMAPEQVSGDPGIDFRADIYSFGCLAYELLTGETPFASKAAHQVLAAHLAEPPPDIRSKCPSCPSALTQLVRQCLEKDPAQRPQSAREIVQVLDGIMTRRSETQLEPRTVPRFHVPRAALAVVIVLVVAAGFALIQQRSTSDQPTAEGTLRSVAVLPFANAGGDTADAYFADGMAEELATALSKVPGLRVVARHSAFRSAGKDVDPTEVGRTLAVDALLAGTVRRSRDQMRLTVQLTRTSDGSLLWSEQYQNQVRDVFAVQDEITNAIVSALHPQLSAATSAVSSAPNVARGTSNLEAYDLYLRGQFNLRRRGRGIGLAVENFEEAIAKDSGFARAHSGLSAALQLLPYFAGVSPDSVFERSTRAARHALTLDSTLAESHTSLALAYQHAFEWARAEEEHRRAVVVDPNDAAAYTHYARFLTYVGRPREALEAAQRAKALDPYSAVIAGWVATTLRFSGNLEAAVTEARRAIELDSANAGALVQVAYTLLAAGHDAEARVAADHISPALSFTWPGVVANVHATTGDRDFAVRLARRIEAMRARPWGAETTLAWAYLGLGDSTRALDALERALDAREMWPSNLSVLEPLYDGVRHSARFALLLRRVGLDPSLFAAPRVARSGQ